MLQPTALKLHPIFTDNQKAIAKDAAKKACVYKIATTVCMVALFAIAASFVATTFGLIAPMHPALFITLFLSTIPLKSYGLNNCLAKARDWKLLAASASGIAEYIEGVKLWNHIQMDNFLRLHQISWEHLEPKLGREELAPAIATYLYLEGQVQFLNNESALCLNNRCENTTLRLDGRNKGHEMMESRVIPLALQAAFVLEIIKHPTSDLNIENFGKCHPKKAGERYFATEIDHDDTYFTFVDPAKTALTLPQLKADVETLNINALHDLLFTD